MEATEKSTKGLQNVLFEELDLLRDGKSTPQNAKAKSTLVNTIVSTKKLEIDMARFVSDARATSKDVQTLTPLEF